MPRVVTILCTMMMCMNENTRILTAEWLQLSCKPGSCGKHAGAGQRRKLQEQLLAPQKQPPPKSPFASEAPGPGPVTDVSAYTGLPVHQQDPH